MFIDIYGYDREIFLLLRGLTIGLGDAGESSIQIRCIDHVQIIMCLIRVLCRCACGINVVVTSDTQGSKCPIVEYSL